MMVGFESLHLSLWPLSDLLEHYPLVIWGVFTCDVVLAVYRDADISLEAIEELRKRMTAGAATFLVKVKVHRGKPANEEANIQADKAISGKDVPTEWHDVR